MTITLSIYKFFAKYLRGTNISKNSIARKVIKIINSRAKLEYVLIDGTKLFLDPSDSLFLSVNGAHEKTVTSLVKMEIKKGDTVLDIGAHIGYYTVIFSQLVGPKGKVYSFEPDPRNFLLLQKTVQENNLTNVEIFNNAVSDKNKLVEFFQSTADSIGNRLVDSVYNESGIKIQINSISIDEFFKNRNDEINFIKLDIQGAEGVAINGLKNILRTNKKIKIMQQWAPSFVSKYDVKPDSHLNFLEELGYNFYVLDGVNNKIYKTTTQKLMKRYLDEDLADVNLFCTSENMD